MIVKHKFSLQFEVDKPICDSCKKEFKPKKECARETPQWEVEEHIYVDGKYRDYHHKCLRKLLRDPEINKANKESNE